MVQPDGRCGLCYYSNISPESTSNFAHYNNPELLQELLDARSIQDDTQRAAVYDHIGQVLSEERPYIPCGATTTWWALQDTGGLPDEPRLCVSL